MTDIRQYRREKENIENEADNDYETRLRNHKIKVIRTIIIVVAVAILGILVMSLIRHKTSYTGYKVENFMRRNDSGYSEYYSFSNKVVRCSKDGIAAYTYQGEQAWNSTYEINNLSVDTRGNYLAVADLNGNKIYTFGSNGFISEINTALPILQVSVSKTGYVTAILEDKNADYINMYSMEGEKIYTIKKTIGIDGIPVSMSVSDDSEKLVAAFTGIHGNTLNTSVVFYNFNEVGQNENERVVGGYDYGDIMVGRVEFINSDTAVAFAEDKISIYAIKEYPSLTKEISVDYEIKYIFTGEAGFGIIHDDEKAGQSKLDVYNSSGSIVYSDVVSDDFSTIKFSGNNILMYNESQMKIVNTKGKVIFEYTFEDGITNIIPINGKDEFMYCNRDYVRRIKLK